MAPSRSSTSSLHAFLIHHPLALVSFLSRSARSISSSSSTRLPPVEIRQISRLLRRRTMGVRRGATPVVADRPFVKRSLGATTVARSMVAKEVTGSAANKSSVSGNKVQDVQRAGPVYMHGLIYRAKLRLMLLEMERTVLPDESIHVRELQCLGIVEHGCPSIIRQLGLFLKAD